MDIQKYLEQIEQYYNGKLKSNQVIKVGDTPQYLTKIGVSSLPIVIKQSTLAKCIREPKGSRSAHELDRVMIESIPLQILRPILVVDEEHRNSVALITDHKDTNGNNMLVALKKQSNVQNIPVNEIVSFYGRNNLALYLAKHNPLDIHIIDSKKAKSLASLLRLQLPTTLQMFDCKHNIPPHSDTVK